MSITSTKTAAAGKFLTHGEDCVQYDNASGEEMCRIDGAGVVRCSDVVTSEGISLNVLQNAVDTIIQTGIPPVVDLGTF